LATNKAFAPSHAFCFFQRSTKPNPKKAFAMLRSPALFLLAAGIAAPSVAQSTAPVELSNFKFTPQQVNLRAGVSTILQLHNSSSGGHSFSAPAFFAAAQVDAASAGLIHDGKIDVPAHGTVQVALTPRAGQYALKCSHLFHSSFGMKGTIAVR
jgi:plastocyanin